MVAAVVIISTAGAALVPGTGGFRARYFANAGAAGSHERSTEHRDRSFTRIDQRLDFAPGGPELPLAFFNDPSRFNFYQPGGPRRRLLEFAAAWNGQWWAEAGTYTLYLEAPEASAQLFVDGRPVASVTPTSGPIEITLPLAAGWHRLDANLSSPYGAPRRFSAGEVRDGARRPFSSSTVVTQRVRPWQVTAMRLLRLAKTVGDGAVLAWLGWLFAVSLRRHLARLAGGLSTLGQRSVLFPLLAIAAAIEALLYAWPWTQQLMVMAGGDDPMTYEWYSRDILLNGILMTVGAPIGAGEPFYYQAFYPYFLAAIHALFGEGMFGVLLIQRLLVAFTVWVIVKIAVEIARRGCVPRGAGLRRGVRHLEAVTDLRRSPERVAVCAVAGGVDRGGDSGVPGADHPAGARRGCARRRHCHDAFHGLARLAHGLRGLLAGVARRVRLAVAARRVGAQFDRGVLVGRSPQLDRFWAVRDDVFGARWRSTSARAGRSTSGSA